MCCVNIKHRHDSSQSKLRNRRITDDSRNGGLFLAWLRDLVRTCNDGDGVYVLLLVFRTQRRRLNNDQHKQYVFKRVLTVCDHNTTTVVPRMVSTRTRDYDEPTAIITHTQDAHTMINVALLTASGAILFAIFVMQFLYIPMS